VSHSPRSMRSAHPSASIQLRRALICASSPARPGSFRSAATMSASSVSTMPMKCRSNRANSTWGARSPRSEVERHSK